MTPDQRAAVEAVHLALASERNAGEIATRPGADVVWRDHFRQVLEQVAAAFPDPKARG